MKGRMNTGLGEIVINPDVIALYAGSVAVECFGIVGMAAVNMKDGLVKLLKKESLTHGINVSISENKISLDFQRRLCFLHRHLVCHAFCIGKRRSYDGMGYSARK